MSTAELLHAYTFDNATTCGAWSTEDESGAAFDAFVKDTGCFETIYHEVCGTLIQPRSRQQNKIRSLVTDETELRIDRILVPSEKLLNAGWTEGPIGVELKRSGEKIGPPIAQMMDYQRAVWCLKAPPYYEIHLTWIFLWPALKCEGNLASLLAQNALGTVNARRSRALYFQSGEVTVLYIGGDGIPKLGSLKNGARAGSR